MRDIFERALDDDPEDLTHWQSYADWLTERGDPRGELMQVQLALENPALPAHQRRQLLERDEALFREHRAAYLGELEPFVQVGPSKPVVPRRGWLGAIFGPARPLLLEGVFERGWLRRLHGLSLEFDAFERLAREPAARFLRHLECKYLWGEDEQVGHEGLLEAPFLGRLETFSLGEQGHGHFAEPWLADVVLRMRQLQGLTLHTIDFDLHRLFTGEFPQLRHLVVCSSRDYPLNLLAANPSFAQLETLIIEPHAIEVGEQASFLPLERLVPLFQSPHLTNLKRLTLMFSDGGDPLCTALAASPLLARLEELNLYGGLITAAGVQTLADAAPAALKRLELGNNAIGAHAAGVAALRSRGVNVTVDHQHGAEDRNFLYEGDME